MDDIKFSIKESYISTEENSLQFQKQMEEFSRGYSNKRIAILSAPTGAGKTTGFKRMETDGYIFILLPNNLLSWEVYKDFSKDHDVVLLNRYSMDQKKQEYIEKKFNVDDDKIIWSMVTGKKIVISNPELFYYIILNKYKYSKRSDAFSDFIRSGLRAIIIDEIHVYSNDQINILLGILKLIHKDIKLMFSSATIPNYFKELINFLFDEKNVLEIKAEREYKQSSNNRVLQGKINCTIVQDETVIFIKNNIDIMKNGYWFIIADSIRNIQNIYNILNKYINTDEIGIISAFHDPGYNVYKEISENQKRRIIIGSNIIEQGINPPKYFKNFIIEPGMDIKNFIQRIGRIGRNNNQESNLYIIFKSEISNSELPEKEYSIEELYDFVEKKLPEKREYHFPKYIGVYSALISSWFSKNLGRIIDENINRDRDGNGFYNGFYSAKHLLEKFEKINEDEHILYKYKRQIRNIKSILKWWNCYYYPSITSFIPPNNKAIFKFDNDKKFSSDSINSNNFSYDALWIRKNTNTEISENGIITIKYFRNKPEYDFNVYASGIPFNPNPIEINYSQISPYKARSYIIENLKDIDENSCSCDECKNFLQNLKDVVYATAGYERLSIKEDDEYE
jgi:CRISPR-associated endonuclease/helicase Cas3